MGIIKDFLEFRKKSAGAAPEDASSRQLAEWNKLAAWLGLTDVPEDALSEATYFACLKILSESLGKLPLKLQQHTEKNGVRSVRDHPLYYILHDRPNPYMTSTTFWASVEINRNHFGNAYVWIDGAGKDTKLWILPSNDVEVWYDNARLLSDVPDIYYLYAGTGKVYRFGSEEILHFRSSNSFDGIVGTSVRDQLRTTVRGGIKSQKLLNGMYDNGFTAKAVLQYTGSLSDENVKTFIRGIECQGRPQARGYREHYPDPARVDAYAARRQARRQPVYRGQTVHGFTDRECFRDQTLSDRRPDKKLVQLGRGSTVELFGRYIAFHPQTV